MTTSWREHETAIWLAAQRAGSLPPDEKKDTERWINFYGAPPALYRVTLGQVLELEGRRHRPGYSGGKIVFVGFDTSVTPASGTRDLFVTPYTRFGHDFAPGVEVLANACANLVRGDWLRRMALLIQCLFAAIFSAGAVAGLILVDRRRAIFVALLLLAHWRPRACYCNGAPAYGGTGWCPPWFNFHWRRSSRLFVRGCR